MRRILGPLLVLFVVVGCSGNPGSTTPTTNVPGPDEEVGSCTDVVGPIEIADPALDEAIRTALGIDRDPTCEDMARLEALTVKNAGIRSLSGLELAVNLASLDLEQNRIQDISAVSGLSKLRDLGLDNNMISDLSPLEELSNLEWLWLGGNVVKDLTPLGGLDQLRGLSLWSNNIDDFTPISNLTSLEHLYVCCTRPFDLAILSELESLTTLDVADSGRTTLQGLVVPSTLERLVLQANRLERIPELSSLSSGAEVLLERNYLTSAQAQAEVAALRAQGVVVSSESQYEPGDLRCEDWFRFQTGAYVYRNNVWNKLATTDYEQCLRTRVVRDVLQVGWTWRWAHEDGRAKAYPEVAYGWVSELPRRIADLNELTVDYALEVDATGVYNVAFDAWIRSEPKATDENADVELMIWVGDGGMVPAGDSNGSFSFGGTTFDLYVDDFPEWKYVAFQAREDALVGSIDLVPFLEHLIDLGLVSGSQYLTSLHLGNEVVAGEGSAWMQAFDVTVR